MSPFPTFKPEKGSHQTSSYWDWTQDSSHGLQSPLWDPITGFGGNGTSPDGCVEGGPLAGVLLNYTVDGYSPHCLSRAFQDSDAYGEMHGKKYTTEIVQGILTSAETYPDFRARLEGGAHKHLHDGTGGEMPIPSSPNGQSYITFLVDQPRWTFEANKLGRSYILPTSCAGRSALVSLAAEGSEKADEGVWRQG